MPCCGSSDRPRRVRGALGLAEMRMTPTEVRANQTGTENIGSSLLAGVRTKVLHGDPSKPGF